MKTRIGTEPRRMPMRKGNWSLSCILIAAWIIELIVPFLSFPCLFFRWLVVGFGKRAVRIFSIKFFLAKVCI